MGVPAVGQVVLVPFPFSDLSHAKMRPAVVLADAGRNEPGKLFTANASLIAETAGALKKAKIRKLIDSVIEILQIGT